VIGRRRLDPHIHAFAELGAQIDIGRGYEMRGGGLRGKPIFLDEASVMATENAVMVATLTPGETVIGNAACEPHVQDLCRFLGTLGARIQGIESNVLRIEGVQSLGGGEWEIGPDHIEVGQLHRSRAITGSDVTIDGVKQADLVSIGHAFEKLGVTVEPDVDCVPRTPAAGARRPGRPRRSRPQDRGRPVARVPVRPDVGRAHGRDAGGRNDPDVREDVREPPVLHGQAREHGRAHHPLRPPPRRHHRPSKLRGQRMESPDIRAGMAMLLASLCADGPSTIGAIHQIDKGYERIDERLRALGAQIERIES
jgi:UDP-N-acetylglucosamine 1-carboxyvinyltransferase